MSDSEEDSEDEFHRAVASGDEKLVLKLIEDGWDVNEETGYGNLPLALAIENNRLATVEVLINKGAIYDNNYFRSESGPLHLAARFGCLEIVEFFIKLGVDVNARNKYLQTPIFWATWIIKDDRCRIIKTLIDAGADINARDKNLRSPLSHAAIQGFYAAFQLLLSMGADIYMDGEIDSKLLDSAARSPNLEIVKWAIEHGYDVNTSNENGSTLLHSAARSSKSEIVEFLLNNGALINVNRYNEDPLCYAVYFWPIYMGRADEIDTVHIEWMKCLELLIAHGANVNRANNKGKTPLYIILVNFEVYKFIFCNDFVRILLENGAKFDFDHPIVCKSINTNRSKFSHLLLRHTAMFEAQNRQDGPTNFDLNKLNDESRTDYTHCRDELESMKATKIDETNVSFFNVLVNRDIGPYTRNENIRNALEDSDLSKRFPIYSDLLTGRFSAELKFQELLAEAAIGLSHVLNWNVDSTRIILNTILCYLDKKDLTNLALI